MTWTDCTNVILGSLSLGFHLINSSSLFWAFLRLRTDAEVKDPIAVRKIQKADREKLRRDRLNEHFLELGNTLGKVKIYVI